MGKKTMFPPGYPTPTTRPLDAEDAENQTKGDDLHSYSRRTERCNDRLDDGDGDGHGDGHGDGDIFVQPQVPLTVLRM